jgi:hypothetical protein
MRVSRADLGEVCVDEILISSVTKGGLADRRQPMRNRVRTIFAS